ncbi:MAG: MFS transporter [Thermodesulfobacteriota bacterium]
MSVQPGPDHRPKWRPQFTVLLLMWLVYGCFYLNKLNLAPVIPLIIADLGLSHAQVGLYSAAFFALYCVTQIPWGYLSDRWGPRKVISLGGLISVGANVFFSLSPGPLYMTVAQGANGLGQGSGWGPSVKLLNNWFAPAERARALGAYTTCISLFTILTYNLSGAVGGHFGWRVSFQLMPLILLLALSLFRLTIRDHPPAPEMTPRPSPSDEPRRRLRDERKLRKVLTQSPVLLASMGFLCSTYITYTNLIWLPTYYYEQFGFSVAQSGLLASLYPALGLLARPMGGYLSDVSLGGRRKPLLLISFLGICLGNLILSQTVHIEWAVGLLAWIGLCDQLMGALFFVILLDSLPPDLAGTGAGLMNACGQLGSMASMFFSGLLMDVFHGYGPVFLSLSLVALIGLVMVGLVREKGDRSIRT